MLGWNKTKWYNRFHINLNLNYLQIYTFTLLRNAVQSLILILSHRNCHAWSYTKTNSPPFTERQTATCSDTGYPTPTRANLHPVRNTEIICAKPSMCFFKTKREKIVRTSREWITRDKFSGLGITSAFCPTFLSLLRITLRFYFAFSPQMYSISAYI